jgi:bacteriocin-like protein
MKKVNLINLKGISEILSEKELKNVMGGSSGNAGNGCYMGAWVELCSGPCTLPTGGGRGECKSMFGDRCLCMS